MRGRGSVWTRLNSQTEGNNVLDLIRPCLIYKKLVDVNTRCIPLIILMNVHLDSISV